MKSKVTFCRKFDWRDYCSITNVKFPYFLNLNGFHCVLREVLNKFVASQVFSTFLALRDEIGIFSVWNFLSFLFSLLLFIEMVEYFRFIVWDKWSLQATTKKLLLWVNYPWSLNRCYSIFWIGMEEADVFAYAFNKIANLTCKTFFIV